MVNVVSVAPFIAPKCEDLGPLYMSPVDSTKKPTTAKFFKVFTFLRVLFTFLKKPQMSHLQNHLFAIEAHIIQVIHNTTECG